MPRTPALALFTLATIAPAIGALLGGPALGLLAGVALGAAALRLADSAPAQPAAEPAARVWLVLAAEEVDVDALEAFGDFEDAADFARDLGLDPIEAVFACEVRS